MNCFNDLSDVVGGVSSDALKTKLIYLLTALMTHQKSSAGKIKCS